LIISLYDELLFDKCLTIYFFFIYYHIIDYYPQCDNIGKKIE